tara:strand:- start:246 stop:431 length:186 start_codon:yes stop_codon:yes gene_type:complete
VELVSLLAFALILGLIIRKRGDNTMDTLSKGCGCLVLLFVIFIILVIAGLGLEETPVLLNN